MVLGLAIVIAALFEVVYLFDWALPGGDAAWHFLEYLLPHSDMPPPAWEYVGVLAHAVKTTVVVYALVVGLILSVRALARPSK